MAHCPYRAYQQEQHRWDIIVWIKHRRRSAANRVVSNCTRQTSCGHFGRWPFAGRKPTKYEICSHVACAFAHVHALSAVHALALPVHHSGCFIANGCCAARIYLMVKHPNYAMCEEYTYQRGANGFSYGLLPGWTMLSALGFALVSVNTINTQKEY